MVITKNRFSCGKPVFYFKNKCHCILYRYDKCMDKYPMAAYIKIWFVLILICVTVMQAHAQIRGKILDSESNLSLENVEISQNGKLIAITNSNGRFSLPLRVAPDTLVFRRLGYDTKRVHLNEADSSLLITLSTKSIEMGDVVIRGYNTTEKAYQSAGAIHVLNTGHIRRFSSHSPAPVINSIPGIYMHSGARNTNRITMRGIGSRSMYTTTKLKAYLNAIPLTSGIGETTLEDLDLSLIDRITVMKGPSSSIYGSPLGGTILYRVGIPTSRGTSIKQEITFGSFNTLKNTTQLTWKSKQTALQLAYSKLNDNGFRENDHYRRDAVMAILRNQATENLGITYLGRYHDLKAYIPSSVSKERFRNNPEEAAENWKAVNGHEAYHKILNGLSFDIDLDHNVRNETALFLKSYKGDEVRPFNILDDQTLTMGGRSLFEWKKKWERWRFMIQSGYELLYESYDWKIYETLEQGDRGMLTNDNSQRRRQHNLFTALELEYGKFKFSTGMNLNKTGYRYKDLSADRIDLSDQKDYQWIISPRFALTYSLTDHLLLFSSISRGLSAPSYEETLNAAGFVNRSIQPETGWNRESGIRGRYWDNRLQFKSSIYSIAVKDLLVTKRIAEDEFHKINAGKTLHTGIEASSRIQWLDNSLFSSSVNINYTYANYRFQNFQDEGRDFSGNLLPGIPKNKLSLEFTFNMPLGTYLNANWLGVDEMAMNDANTLYADAYHRMNLKAGVRRSLTEHLWIDLYGGIHNLTNNHYASMILINAPSYGGSAPRYYYPAEPRNLFGGFSLRYALQ